MTLIVRFTNTSAGQLFLIGVWSSGMLNLSPINCFLFCDDKLFPWCIVGTMATEPGVQATTHDTLGGEREDLASILESCTEPVDEGMLIYTDSF